MNNYFFLLRIGFLLMALGIILNRAFADFPAWAVGIIHLSAIVCFSIYFIKQRKHKK